MASVCIICEKPASGAAVADTPVIRAIRRAKEMLRIAAGNTLVVCPGCQPEHAKRRAAYERKQLMYSLFGALLVVLSIALPLLSGAPINWSGLVMFVLLALAVSALALLSYTAPLVSSPSQLPLVDSIPKPPSASAFPSKPGGGPAVAPPARRPLMASRSKPASKPAARSSGRPKPKSRPAARRR